MTSKYCNKCNKSKLLSEFNKRESAKNGRQSTCRDCTKINKNRYIRTREGLISRIYYNQCSHSKRRGHEMPDYTLEDIRNWTFNQSNFESLYQNWKTSGFDRTLSPSCDRLDDYKPYTLDNLQLVTWGENNAKGHADRVNGINNKNSKGVLQFTREGLFIAEYYSQKNASRLTGVCQGDISSCCNDKLKSAGCYVWAFS